MFVSGLYNYNTSNDISVDMDRCEFLIDPCLPDTSNLGQKVGHGYLYTFCHWNTFAQMIVLKMHGTIVAENAATLSSLCHEKFLFSNGG